MILAIIIVGALLVAVFLGAYYAFRVAFFVPEPRSEDYHLLPSGEQYDLHRERLKNCIDKLYALPFEKVEVRSYDGKKLFGRYYHVADGAPVQIQFHGYRGSAMRDLCGGAPLAFKLGHNVLLVDQRAHGSSEGSTISFGVRERRDCQCWCRYARERFGENTQLVLVGVSMGAATVLMASDMELPETVRAVVADCPYSSPREIICRVAADAGLPAKPCGVFCSLGALIYGRFRLGSVSAVESVKKSRLPVLLLHGEDDRFVPCDMSRQIQGSCGDRVRLETFPKAAHGMCYMQDPKRYEAAVGEFLTEHLAS